MDDDNDDNDDALPPLPPPPPPQPPPPPPPSLPLPPHYNLNPQMSPGATAAAPASSLASEAYLAVRDFLSASVAEARGDRGSAAAHAAAAASRVQTAVEAEGALPRGDFGPVCDLLATAFAWKAQALSDAVETATPTDAGVGCLSPSLLSAALPPPLQLAAPPPFTAPPPPPPLYQQQHRRHRPLHHHQSRYLDDEFALPGLPLYPLQEGRRQQQQQGAGGAGAGSGGAGGNGNGDDDDGGGGNDDGNHEDAALEAELVRRCMRRPAGLPPDSRALSRVQGLPDVKRELEDAMLLPTRLPPRLRRALRGVRRPPRTFLLHGPPGTGKTLLAEAAAAAAGACLLCASPSAVLSKWSGESERAVRLLFRAARRLAPCVVFFDEVDALGASRGGFAGGGGGEAAAGNQDALARRVLTELLVQMSRLESDGGGGGGVGEREGEAGGGGEEGENGAGDGRRRGPVWVLAATNRPCDVDPALLRRFERRVAVPLPDAEGRAALVRAALRELEEEQERGEEENGAAPDAAHALCEADVARVAAAMRGLSGADVRAVARRAALAPVRELAGQARLRWEAAAREGEGEDGAGEGGGRKRRRGAQEEEEDDDYDDRSLQLRPVCAADWDAALAALFGGGLAGGDGEEEGGGASG